MFVSFMLLVNVLPGVILAKHCNEKRQRESPLIIHRNRIVYSTCDNRYRLMFVGLRGVLSSVLYLKSISSRSSLSNLGFTRQGFQVVGTYHAGGGSCWLNYGKCRNHTMH